ncbi:diguanylate cyclase [Treponema ruminis]|uniref:Diguanylate cyclase (GGDEF)-like protein n=1 Tax=Treponema ruminis TaxID=744515 RepID=A0A7W8LN25_9SPIR|nr:diguanylate cyclase [Treponema ruminis]MBB5226938.1 diguanylate cyclase (GGDEF)-like protein [Treponema ruminis]QSI01365.1 diguanylate cyclase [Treponema ruminis]
MGIKLSSRNTKIILLVFVLVALVTASLFVFRLKTLNIMSNTSLQNISEIQAMYAQTLQTKFADQMSMLEAQARYFENIDLNNDEALKKTIVRTKGIGDFKKIGIVNKSGATTSTEGKNLSNIYNKPYFFDAIKSGKPQISNRIEVDENLDPILTLIYPIKQENSVKAAIKGTLSYDVLKNLFAVSLFSGESYMYIISADGNVILCNRDKKRNLYNINIYDLIKNAAKGESEYVSSKMRADILKSHSNFMTFSAKDSYKLFAYSPLGINNWYIISVIPYSYIVQKQAAIVFWVYVLLGVIAFTISMFIFLLYGLFKKNTSIEKDNERLTIANAQAQTLIFEYDVPRHQITFSGDTQFILGTEQKVYPIDFIRAEYYKRIHNDDKKVMTELKRTIENALSEFTGEFRYKNFTDNEYIWLRISGSLIDKEDGSGKKFIGTITNVNSQVLHEQELKSIAERDKLTGLLNKAAMEQHSRNILTGDNKQRSVLFIIDLDNFKKVNDTLGHLIGDMAIVDAGKKLSLIFSEKDFISRFGGDEFCILMRFSKNLSDEEISRIIIEKAQNLCIFLREDYFDEKTVISVSASVGIAFYPENGSNYEELFAAADSALYKVKESGKNGYRFFGKNE